MIEIVFPDSRFAELRSQLLADSIETCAVALAQPIEISGGGRLLVTEIIRAFSPDYVERNDIRAVLTPEFLAPLFKRAALDRLSLVFFHTHPFEDIAAFSSIDRQGELVLLASLKTRNIVTARDAIVELIEMTAGCGSPAPKK